MILPVGHQETSVRRLPWVSFGIIALCLAALLATDPGDEPLDLRDPTDFLTEAADFWRARPYLDAEPEIRTEVAYDVLPEEREAYLELLDEMGAEARPVDPERLLAEQEELDLLSDVALGRLSVQEAGGRASPYARWGWTPARPTLHGLVTHLFVHAGWLHLLGNLILFFLVAPPIEDRWGRPVFGAFFVVAGMLGAGVHTLVYPSSQLPLVGASGAVAGCMGAFLVLFWSTRIRFLYFIVVGFRPFTGFFDAPAYLMLPLWLAGELLQGLVVASAGVEGGVAYWAHVGGFAAGAAIALAMRAGRIEERFLSDALESKVTLAVGHPAVDQALDLRRTGREEDALVLLLEARREDPADPDLALALWDTAIVCRQPEQGAEAMGVVIRHAARSGDVGRAIERWQELDRTLPGRALDAQAVARMAEEVERRCGREVLARLLRAGIHPESPGVTASSALRIGHAASEIDPATALLAYHRALRFDQLDRMKQSEIEERIAALERAGAAAPGIHGGGADAAALPAPPPGTPPALDPARALEIDLDEDPELPSPEKAVLLDPALDGRVLELSAEGALENGDAAPLGGELEAELLPSPPPLPREAVLPGMTGPVGRALPPYGPASPEATEHPDPDRELAFALGDTGPRFHDLKVLDARPVGLRPDALALEKPSGRGLRLEWARIEAVAVGAVHGLGERPVVLVDLLLDWRQEQAAALRSVRLRSDRLDARVLFPGRPPAEAFRSLLDRLLEATRAQPLPDPAGARGRPFRAFPDLLSYEREVLRIAR